MARPKKNATEESQAETPAGTAETAADATKTPSKADAVRAAIAEGIEDPQDIVDFVQRRFGIEMSKGMASSYKSQDKARNAKKQAGEKPPRKKREPAAAAAPASKPSNGQGDVVDAVATVKALVQQLGSDRVKKLVDLLG